MKSKTVDEEVVICRFGSAFGTLTVMLLETRTHDKIQNEMKRLDTKQKLKEPRFELGERVCFKNNHGIWTRACIASICENETSESLHVDIVLDDTSETLKCVDSRALVALPSDLRSLRKAKLYFIEGLEPLRVFVGPQGTTMGRVGAQASANALNQQWTSPPRGTRLVRCTPLPTDNMAKRTKLDIALVQITQCLSLHSYISNILSDHVVSYCGNVGRNYPIHQVHNGERIHPPLLCPLVSEKEVCEVVSLRKARSNILEVGLRLSTYVDLGLLKVMIDKPLHSVPLPIAGPASVSISKDGLFQQRGVLFEDGKTLGIDTLESFEPGSVQTRILPYAVRHAMPHVGIIIEWDISVRPRTPCIGDTVIVEDLEEIHHDILRYSYKDISFVDGPTVITYHPWRARSDETATSPELVTKSKGKYKKKSPTLAEWYGLCGEIPEVFKTVMFPEFDPTLEALFAQHGVAVQLMDP